MEVLGFAEKRDYSSTFIFSCLSLCLFLSLSLIFHLCIDIFFPDSFKPEVLFKLSQTPTPGNKNIVGFSPITFLFKIKNHDHGCLTREKKENQLLLANEDANPIIY